MTYKQKIEELRENVRNALNSIQGHDENSAEYKEYVSTLIELSDFIGKFIKSGSQLDDILAVL